LSLSLSLEPEQVEKSHAQLNRCVRLSKELLAKPAATLLASAPAKAEPEEAAPTPDAAASDEHAPLARVAELLARGLRTQAAAAGAAAGGGAGGGGGGGGGGGAEGGAVQAALMRAWQLDAAGAAAGAAGSAAGAAGSAAEAAEAVAAAAAAAAAPPALKCSRLPELSRRMATLCTANVLGERVVARGAARQEALVDLRLAVVGRAAALRAETSKKVRSLSFGP
jgi:hypothetical protein